MNFDALADSLTDMDVSKLHEARSAETMRRLANEEQAAGHEPW
jgi:hypothetical protein